MAGRIGVVCCVCYACSRSRRPMRTLCWFQVGDCTVQQERTVTALQMRLRCVCGEFGEKAVTESGGSG